MGKRIDNNISLLKNYSDFRNLLLAAVTSELGTQMQRFALPWLIFNITGSGALMAFNFSLSLLPGLFLGIIGGVISDRIDRKKLLLAGDFASFLFIFAVLVIHQFDSPITIILLFVLTFLLACITSIYSPALMPLFHCLSLKIK